MYLDCGNKDVKERLCFRKPGSRIYICGNRTHDYTIIRSGKCSLHLLDIHDAIHDGSYISRFVA